VTPETDIRAAHTSRRCNARPREELSRRSALTSPSIHHTALMSWGWYTAFRGMIIVSLWLFPRCAKRGSRLCGGGPFGDRGQCLLFHNGTQLSGESGKCSPPPEGQKPPLRLTQSSRQPTYRRADEGSSSTGVEDRRRPLGSSL
jgi:hypothetical protein